MSLKIINGDLLEIKSGVILHQVNCRKVCGGLAGALHRRFPIAFEVYFDDARPESERLGTFLLGQHADAFSICHIFGQFNPGSNTDIEAARSAITRAGLMFATYQIPLYAPYKMGCGLGGGNWTQYSALLEKYLPTLTIVQKYQ